MRKRIDDQLQTLIAACLAAFATFERQTDRGAVISETGAHFKCLRTLTPEPTAGRDRSRDDGHGPENGSYRRDRRGEDLPGRDQGSTGAGESILVVPIPEAATKIHGITDSDVKDKPGFDVLAAGAAEVSGWM